MRLIFSLLTFGGLAFGGWYAWENVAPLRQFVQKHLNSGEFRTLEIRYSAEEIMQNHQEEFLKNPGYSFLEPKLMYYPYLLMSVKYSKDRASTGEGILLWGLHDGEMVVNTGTWERTHGFEDCLISKADKNDFKILLALIENGGAIDREKLYHRFKVDHDILDDWVDSCRHKKLIVISGNKFRLHFDHPHLETQPITHLDQALVTHPAKFADKIKGNYSSPQIRKLTQIAFGNDFAIRKTLEVFLPVYSIAIQNPDGSVLTTYWNALNGKRMEHTVN